MFWSQAARKRFGREQADRSGKPDGPGLDTVSNGCVFLAAPTLIIPDAPGGRRRVGCCRR